MNVSLPIFRRELAAAPRRRRFWLLRASLVGCAAIVIVFGLLVSGSDATTMGLRIYSTLSFAALAVLPLVAASNAAALIQREKEERTLGLLFLSDISPWSFVLGKYLTAVFSTMMAMLSLLPLFMLAVSLGGVSSTQILAAFVLIVATALLAAAVALWAATLCASARNASGLLGLIALIYFLFLPVALMIRSAILDTSFPRDVLCLVSPVASLSFLVMDGAVPLSAYAYGAAVPPVCALFLGLTVAVLPSRILTRDRPPVSEQIRERLRKVRRMRRWTKPPPVGGNPVVWKDLYYFHGGIKVVWVKFAASTALLLMAVSWPFFVMGEESRGVLSDVAWTLLYVVFFICLAVVALGVVSHLGMAFQNERKARGLDILLLTDLSDSEVLRGKVVAAALSVFPWACGAAACGLLLLARYGDDWETWQVAGFLTLEYGAALFLYGAVALWSSLRFRRNYALPLCILGFVAYSFLVRGMLIQIASALDRYVPHVHSDAMMTLMVGVDVLIQYLAGGIFVWRVVSSFREMALTER